MPCLTYLQRFFILMAIALFFAKPLFADKVSLVNGDHLVGTVVHATNDSIVLSHPILGELTIAKNNILPSSWQTLQPVVHNLSQPSDAAHAHWKGSVDVGLNLSDGNTDNTGFYGRWDIQKSFNNIKRSIKTQAHQSSSEGVSEEEKWSAEFEQANTLHNPRWFTFYKFAADHDRFADIDYRLIPSVGLGYFIMATDDTKLNIRTGLAYESTHYRDTTPSDEQMLVIPSANLDMKVFTTSHLTALLELFPSFDGEQGYRTHMEVALLTPINTKISFKLSAIDDYDSEPTDNTFKNDIKILSSIVYHI